MEATRGLLESSAFGFGLLCGAVAFFCSAIAAWLDRRDKRPAVAGLAFTGAAIVGMRSVLGEASFPDGAVLAIALLLVGGTVARRADASLARTAALLVPGGAMLALALPAHLPAWIPWFAGAATAATGALIDDCDRAHSRDGAITLLFLIALGGAYVTLPDTEYLHVVVGAALPLVLVSLPWPIAKFGGAGSAAAAGVYFWVVAQQGYGREGSVVGAAGALGLLLWEPIGRRLTRAVTKGRKRSRGPNREGRFWVISIALISQTVIAWYSARVAGLEESAWVAAVILLPAVAVATLAAEELFPDPRRHASGRRRNGHGRESRVSQRRGGAFQPRS